MKYLIKNTTANTLWKKLIPPSKSVPTATDGIIPTPSKDSSITKPPVHIHGVKLLTWSRNFDFSPFMFPVQAERDAVASGALI